MHLWKTIYVDERNRFCYTLWFQALPFLNIIVFGEYIFARIQYSPTDFRVRGMGLIFLYVTCCIHGFSVRHGVKVQNFIGFLKLLLAALIVGTGIWVVFFPSSITHIEPQLIWELYPVKTSITLSSFASAVIKGTFAYGGWNSIHTVSNEIIDPVRTLKIAGPVSLGIITITICRDQHHLFGGHSRFGAHQAAN